MIKSLLKMHFGDAQRDKLLWEKAADDFINFVRTMEEAEKGDYLRQTLLIPTILECLGDINNLSVLDAGCGEGVLSHFLSEKGANVIGIDSSPKMIEAAKKRGDLKKSNVEFKLSSAEDTELFDENSFDVVVANMLFQEMSEVEDAFKNLVNYLKPGGKLVVSVLHPAFDMNDSQRLSLGKIAQEGLQSGQWSFELFAPYSQSRRHERNYTFSTNPVAYYFRPIQYYVNQFIKHDVCLNGFFEPTLTQEQAMRNMHSAHAYFVPRFLVLGGEKK